MSGGHSTDPKLSVTNQSKGMNPIPAPTGYHVKKIQKISPAMFFPSSKGIDKMERVVYEYLGTAWARLRRQITHKIT